MAILFSEVVYDESNDTDSCKTFSVMGILLEDWLNFEDILVLQKVLNTRPLSLCFYENLLALLKPFVRRDPSVGEGKEVRGT